MKTSEYKALSKEEKKKVKFKDLPSFNKFAIRFFFGCVALVTIALIVDNANTPSTPEAPEVNNDAEYAQLLTPQQQEKDLYDRAHFIHSEIKEQVETQLKYPATADFDFDHTTLIQDAKEQEVMDKGTLTAKNAFGVPVNMQYSVLFKCRRDGIVWESVVVR